MHLSSHLFVILKVPFREAHEMAGKVVALAEKKNVDMMKLNHNDLQEIRYAHLTHS